MINYKNNEKDIFDILDIEESIIFYKLIPF